MDESLDVLQRTLSEYESHYKDWYTEMEAAENYYTLKYEPASPPGLPPILPPTAQTRVDQAVQAMVTTNPKVRRHRSNDEGVREKADNDNIELALQGFLLDAENYSQTPLLQEASKFQILRGGAVLGGPFYEEDEQRCYFEVFDPMTVLIEPGNRPRQGFLIVEMTVSELEQLAEVMPKFQDWGGTDKKKTDMVKLVQWWHHDGKKTESGRYAAWIADADFVCNPMPSGYPYLPLDMVWSGWGRRTLGSKPEEIGRSILSKGTRTLLKSEAELYTMEQYSAQEQTWNRYKLRQGATLPQGFKIDMTPNSITPDWPDGLEPIERLALSPEVSAQLTKVEARLSEALYSTILQGQRQAGVGTATAYSLLAGFSKKRFEPPLRHLEAGVERLLYRVGVLCAFLEGLPGKEKKTLSWRGAEIKNDMYHDDYTVEVDLAAEDEEEKRIKLAEGVSLWDKMPHRWIGEHYLEAENWSQIEEDKIYEDLIYSEGFQQEVLAIFTGVMRQRQAEEAKKTGEPNTTMETFTRMVRAEREGFQPTQPGTVEGTMANIGQAGMIPSVLPR